MTTQKIAATAVEDAIGNDDVFFLPAEEFSSLRQDLLETYVKDVVVNCVDYRQFLEPCSNLTIHQLPFIPTSVFKNITLLTISPTNVEKWCVSSGTLGTRSNIGRNRTSLERLLGTVRAGLSFLDDWREDDVTVLHLGPSFEESGDVWLPYVMSLTELLFPTESFARGDDLDISAALDRYGQLRASGHKVAVLGPPFAVDRLCAAHLERKYARSGGADVIVITAGGWKNQVSHHTDRRAFRNYIVETLGLSGEDRVRDAFSQVELNTILVECEAHRFHLPPWLLAVARSPLTLAPLPPGEVGLLSYIDASAASWPCIIVGDDVGYVDSPGCACGRMGDTLTIARRIERGLAGGCASTLADRFAAAA